jgi:hypothetical protein
MIRRAMLIVSAASMLAMPAVAAASPQEFGIDSAGVSLSTAQAGAHPDLTLKVNVKQDPTSEPNAFGLKDSFAPTRHVRFETPAGLIGNPNVLGTSQQCTVQELTTFNEPGGGCPSGSQIGRATIVAYSLQQKFVEPVYMMVPPGGDVVARLGTIAGLFPTFINLRVRSESDYGLVAEVRDATSQAKLVQLETTLWGVPTASSHDTERCTAQEAFNGCIASESRPPGSRELPFLTNPTRCGAPLTMTVGAASWVEPERFDTVGAPFPAIGGCNKLPFGPGLTIEPTSHRPSSPTGLDVTIRLPASEGVKVLEPSQMRNIRVRLPEGLGINTDASDGLATCSPQQVRLGERVAAECPDAAKMADAEFDIPALPRRMQGAVYLREPEPGNPFRIWLVADDLGAHVKIPGQLHIDLESGEIESIVLDAPQAPVREVRLAFKSGFRAPLVTPPTCGTYVSSYEFVPWAGGPPATGTTQFSIDEGCSGQGGFSPQLLAGSVEPAAGQHSPFIVKLTREDGEQNPANLEIQLPAGIAATFAGIPRCEGAATATGACPPGSRIGRVIAAIGTGPAPLWIPQPGKRPTAVYLSGPYKGAPLSIVAVVPRQAGPFDFGDEVVRSAVYVDRTTAQATAKTDSLPQRIEGIPILYRTIQIELDRPDFVLNPTSCGLKRTTARIVSTQGAVANPVSPFRASNCADLGFKPNLKISLLGGTRRASFPKLTARLRMPSGGANIAGSSVILPHSELIENAHFNTICTRVQFASNECPAGSIYGFATVKTPLIDGALKGPVYLRSSNHTLPDLVVALKGPPSLPIEVDVAARVDSVKGRLRTTFESVPDAPVSEFTLHMKGGAKGLVVNSENLCLRPRRAKIKFTAQNGKVVTLHSTLHTSCSKGDKQTRHLEKVR